MLRHRTPRVRPASTATVGSSEDCRGARRTGTDQASPLALPRPQQLAALGAVLCLHRPQSGGELAGWTHAVHAEIRAALDSDGVHEELLFTDRDGRCCWRLCLLPDSDFLAWEQLCATLTPSRADRRPAQASMHGVGERLWMRLADRLRGERWQACALHLHALHGSLAVGHGGPPVLAASPATLSPLGASFAQRIARGVGAGIEGVREDCCCERAARHAATARVARDPASDSRDGSDAPPLVRL